MTSVKIASMPLAALDDVFGWEGRYLAHLTRLSRDTCISLVIPFLCVSCFMSIAAIATKRKNRQGAEPTGATGAKPRKYSKQTIQILKIVEKILKPSPGDLQSSEESKEESQEN